MHRRNEGRARKIEGRVTVGTRRRRTELGQNEAVSRAVIPTTTTRREMSGYIILLVLSLSLSVYYYRSSRPFSGKQTTNEKRRR
jgi:hypothetical protein